MRTKTLEQNSAQDFAGLQVDQLQKLRNGNMTFEQVKWFNNLSFDEREKLMGKLVKSGYPKMKLVDPHVVVSGIVGEFNPKQHFTKNKKVKYWRSYNFDEHVLDPAKAVSNPPEMNFSKHQFTELITDKEIMDHFQISKSSGLMTREEILWAIASLTSKQPKGEAGALLNNGHSTIIGYMICNDGVVRYVRADWVFGNARWYCYCNDLDDVWRAGNGVLSRS